MYIQKGGVKLSVFSKGRKEAVVAILGPGDFLGEMCLIGRLVRTATATGASIRVLAFFQMSRSANGITMKM